MLTLVFTAPKKWTLISWLIKKFTKSKASHALIGTDLHGVPVFLHCTMGGVKITPRDRYEDPVVAEYKFNDDMEDGVKHAVEHIGDHYDYVALLGYAILIMAWNWFKKKIKNPLASPKAMVCSEFAMHIDHEGKIPEWKDMDPERTSAQDLIEVCEKSSHFTKII